jgi:hypothetical protein
MFILLHIFLTLHFNNKICTALRPEDLHKHWHWHLERKYAIANIFPIIKHFAGESGNVLEVGCEPYNQYDARMAQVDPKHWYFVDPQYRGLNETESGTEIVQVGGFGKMNSTLYAKKFRVIYDNVAQFFSNRTKGSYWAEVQTYEAFLLHMNKYQDVIEIGGHLIMK